MDKPLSELTDGELILEKLKADIEQKEARGRQFDIEIELKRRLSALPRPSLN